MDTITSSQTSTTLESRHTLSWADMDDNDVYCSSDDEFGYVVQPLNIEECVSKPVQIAKNDSDGFTPVVSKKTLHAAKKVVNTQSSTPNDYQTQRVDNRGSQRVDNRGSQRGSNRGNQRGSNRGNQRGVIRGSQMSGNAHTHHHNHTHNNGGQKDSKFSTREGETLGLCSEVKVEDDTSIDRYIPMLNTLCRATEDCDARDVGLCLILLMSQSIVGINNGYKRERELQAFAIQFKIVNMIYEHNIPKHKWIAMFKHIVKEFNGRIRDIDKHFNKTSPFSRCISITEINAAKLNNENLYKCAAQCDDLPAKYKQIIDLELTLDQ